MPLSPRARWLVLIGVVVVGISFAVLLPSQSAVVQVLIPQPSPTTPAVALPGAMIYAEAIVGKPRDLNPLLSDFNDADQDITSLVFSGLTTNDINGQVRPALAQSWELSDDGLTYTFALRRNVR